MKDKDSFDTLEFEFLVDCGVSEEVIYDVVRDYYINLENDKDEVLEIKR